MIKIKTSTTQKTSSIFCCEKCNFICSKKGDWNRHVLRPKHINDKNDKNKTLTSNLYICNCGKTYKFQSGLSIHKKKCMVNDIDNDTNNDIPFIDSSNNTIIMLVNQNIELIKQNHEFKDLIIDQNKDILELVNKTKCENINNITNNNGNNTFNLQFFLNEKCKDALNIEDFVNQIKLQISDLDMIGKVGYVEGITKIFLKNLKALDIYKRPIHCSDLKRETLYIKDKDAWEKENEENKKIKKAIKGIENKNVDQIPQWMNENPAYNDYDSNKHIEYHHILIESMGGSSNDDDKKHNKIVRNIVKEIVIDKT